MRPVSNSNQWTLYWETAMRAESFIIRFADAALQPKDLPDDRRHPRRRPQHARNRTVHASGPNGGTKMEAVEIVGRPPRSLAGFQERAGSEEERVHSFGCCRNACSCTG